MNTYTLTQYDSLRKQLPVGLIAEDFSGIKKIAVNEAYLDLPFTQNEIPLILEGSDLNGIGFYPLLKAPKEVLDSFLVELSSPLPQLFCYENPNHIYVLSIADNTTVKEPISIRLNSAPDNLAFTLLVHVGENAKVTIVEKFECIRDRLILYNQNVVAKENSDCRIISIQNLTEVSQLYEFRETHAGTSARVHWLNFQLGAKKVYSSLTHIAHGEGAQLDTDLLCRTKNDQDHQFELKNIYKARNGRGRIMVRGAALDKSRLGMHGCIKIEQTGGGTDVHLTQDSLLLSKEAKIKATPSLEIDTNDVKAAHSASVSNLSDESLFYLSSRGIEKEQARKMMTQGFLTEQLNKINDLPELKEKILTLL